MPPCAARKQIPLILGEHLIASALMEVPMNTDMSASRMFSMAWAVPDLLTAETFSNFLPEFAD
jgi:hypothetical protein